MVWTWVVIRTNGQVACMVPGKLSVQEIIEDMDLHVLTLE